jgi:hypothetical protein
MASRIYRVKWPSQCPGPACPKAFFSNCRLIANGLIERLGAEFGVVGESPPTRKLPQNACNVRLATNPPRTPKIGASRGSKRTSPCLSSVDFLCQGRSVDPRLKVRSKSVAAGKSMLQLRHAKYATRSIDEYARNDGTLFRSTTSGPGEPRERTKAWALNDRRH